MLINSKTAEESAIMNLAYSVCAAARLNLLGEYKLVMGIPLSVSGKSVFYDRD